MKITLVTETYPPEVNGVARTLERLVRGLLERGHGVQLVRPRPLENAERRVSEGLSEVLTPGFRIPFYRSLQFGISTSGFFRRMWEAERPDVAHVATEGPLGWCAVSAARRLGMPVVSSYHTNFDQYGGYYGAGCLRPGILRYLRWFHNRTRATFVPTRQGKRTLGRQGFENLRVFGRGVDAALFSPGKRSGKLRSSWGAADDTPVCLYAGRLAAEKNIGLAVAAFERMQQRRPDVRFVLVGDGPLEEGMRNRHSKLILAGCRTGEDLAAHYASADVFLFPSQTETFGNVVTEAMASGLIIVAFRNGAAAEHLADGESALIAEMGDSEGFLQRSERAVLNLAGSRGLGRTARQAALGLTWDRILDGYEVDVNEIVMAAKERRRGEEHVMVCGGISR